MNETQARLEREAAFHDHREHDDSERESAHKFYKTAERARAGFWQLIEDLAGPGTAMLEIGCGHPKASRTLTQLGAAVTAIDISPAVIAAAREQTAGPTRVPTFEVMNAQDMTFADNSFDVVWGSGVLHHLDLVPAAREIGRVLKPGGVAVFHEPLAHNPAIALYRRLTPKMRSVDEVPLHMADLELLTNVIGPSDITYYGMTTLAIAPFLDQGWSTTALRKAESFDAKLFSSFAFMRRYAWMVNVVLTKPGEPV